jgi:hypothetical protein
LPKLATSLINLGVELGAVGRWEVALVPTEEVVEDYRRLAQANAAAYLPDLAWSLTNLGDQLNAVGHREEQRPRGQKRSALMSERNITASPLWACWQVTSARRADPREHGRQAARSVRDRPAGRRVKRPTYPRPRAAGALDPIEANSATQRAVTLCSPA